jgi:ABC-type Fe3+-hydroxamate transport system substrate-binding protein
MKQKAFFTIIAYLAMVIVLTACTKTSNEDALNERAALLSNPEQTEPIKFTDLINREIILNDQPKRIIVANFITNYLMVGGSESLTKVIGFPFDGWEDYRYGEYVVFTQSFPQMRDIPSIADYHDHSVNTEKIVSLNPDIILMSPSQYTENNNAIALFEKADIPVVVLDYISLTVETHTKSNEILGLILGREEIAREQNNTYISALNNIYAKVATLQDIEKHKRVYVELGNKGIGEYGVSYPGDQLWGSIINSVDGNSISSHLNSYVALDKEYVVTSDPEVIIMDGSVYGGDAGDQIRMGFTVDEETAQARLRAYAKRPEWANLSAIRTGEVYATDLGSLCNMSDYVFTQFLAKVLYPELFEDIDPLANMQSFYAKYLPELKYTGTFMIKIKQSR